MMENLLHFRGLCRGLCRGLLCDLACVLCRGLCRGLCIAKRSHLCFTSIHTLIFFFIFPCVAIIPSNA